MSIDDIIKEMQDDEASDRAEQQKMATPIDYARLRSRSTGKTFAPQKVYYSIRNRRLKLYDCICGRHVINIEEADKLFGFTQEDDEDDERNTD